MSRKKIIHILIIVLLISMALVQIFPFYLKVIEALQPLDFIPNPNKIYWLPQSINFKNFIIAFKEADLFIGFINSTITVIGYISISTIIMVIVSYVLEKMRFRGRKFIFILLLSTMMIPGEVMMISNYFVVSELGLNNSLLSIILPGVVNVFGIFLCKQFLNPISNSIFEAAEIDGANEIVKIFYIVFPMLVPCISSYVILTFVSIWNEYLWPYIILSNQELYTIQLKLMYYESLTGTARDGILKSSGMLLAILPIIIIYFIFQKQFVEGISISGIK